MFRFTIYSIVGYAFWLTFVDISAYAQPSPNGGWFNDIQALFVDDKPVNDSPVNDAPKPILTTAIGTSHCQTEQHCSALPLRAAN